MFKRKGALLVPLLIGALVFSPYTITVAAGAMGPGGGGVQQSNRFSAYGTVKTIDSTSLTMSVALLGASRLLKADIGSGTPVDFTLASNVKVRGSKGMTTGGMGGGMMGPGGPGGGGGAVDNVQTGDFIWLYGYQDTNGGFVVTQINVWLN